MELAGWVHIAHGFAKIMEERTWISVSDAADQLGMSSQAVRDLIRSNKLDGRKNASDRWRVDPNSLSRYISEHGRKERGASPVELLEQRLNELTRRVDSLQESTAEGSRLETAERERDRYRSDASTLREVARLYVEASEDTDAAVASLFAASRKHRDALAQLMRPGSPEGLMSSGGRGETT